MVRSVRPWKPPSKHTTAGRPVAARANFTAFSTASAPALKNAALRSPPPVSSISRSASSTYCSYGITEKSVWDTLAACRCTASTTFGCEYPTSWHPRPPEKSSQVLPSTSVNRAPSPRSITAGTWMSSGSHTTFDLRARISFERGPGISVTRSIAPIANLLGTFAPSRRTTHGPPGSRAREYTVLRYHGPPRADSRRSLGVGGSTDRSGGARLRRSPALGTGGPAASPPRARAGGGVPARLGQRTGAVPLPTDVLTDGALRALLARHHRVPAPGAVRVLGARGLAASRWRSLVVPVAHGGRQRVGRHGEGRPRASPVRRCRPPGGDRPRAHRRRRAL